MIYSLVLAQILGIYLIIMGMMVLVCPRPLDDFISSIDSHPALAFLAATMAIILGIVMIVFHNLWVWDWRLIVTLIAWLTLIKGLVWMIIPEMPIKFSKRIYRGPLHYILGILVVLLGCFLFYEGNCFSNWVLVESSQAVFINFGE